MKFVNLTPHVLRIQKEDGSMMTLEPEPTPARIAARRVPVGTVDGVTIYRSEYGAVEGLPEPAEDTIYVVSFMTLMGVFDRCDLASPGEIIRDEAGRPYGCIGLNLGG